MPRERVDVKGMCQCQGHMVMPSALVGVNGMSGCSGKVLRSTTRSGIKAVWRRQGQAGFRQKIGNGNRSCGVTVRYMCIAIGDSASQPATEEH